MGTFTNNGTVFASDATVGAVAITNPGNAQFVDASYATSVLVGGQISNYLKVTGFNFTIPTDATVTGVTVNITRHSTVGSTMNDSSIKLVKGGVISGNDKASGTAWGTGDATIAYGSASDLWGLNLAPSDVNASTFGVAVSATTTLAATVDIDCVSITIDYTGSNRTNRIRQTQVGAGMSRSELN